MCNHPDDRMVKACDYCLVQMSGDRASLRKEVFDLQAKLRTSNLQVEALRRAAEYAVDALEVIVRTGRPAQGGEQRGNLECIEIAHAKLAAAVAEKRIREGPICASCGWNNGPDHGGGIREMYTVGKLTRCGSCIPTTR